MATTIETQGIEAQGIEAQGIEAQGIEAQGIEAQGIEAQGTAVQSKAAPSTFDPYSCSIIELIKFHLSRTSLPGLSLPDKIEMITELYEYLLTDEVQELLKLDGMAKFKRTVIRKYEEFTGRGSYITNNPRKCRRLIAAITAIKNHLTGVEYLRKRRGSERVRLEHIKKNCIRLEDEEAYLQYCELRKKSAELKQEQLLLKQQEANIMRPLPVGWRVGYMAQDEPYYLNYLTKTVTWTDPRLPNIGINICLPERNIMPQEETNVYIDLEVVSQFAPPEEEASAQQVQV